MTVVIGPPEDNSTRINSGADSGKEEPVAVIKKVKFNNEVRVQNYLIIMKYSIFSLSLLLPRQGRGRGRMKEGASKYS